MFTGLALKLVIHISWCSAEFFIIQCENCRYLPISRFLCIPDALFLIISGSTDPSSPSHIAFTAMWKVFYSSNDTETSKGAAPAENVGAEADSDTDVKQEGSAEESKTDTAESKTETGE